MRLTSVAIVLAVLGVAGVSKAQTGAGQITQPSQTQAQIPTAADGSFTDECDFRYNSRGDRIDARGRVMPPPVSPPNGRTC
jgi:hypothetical protein